MIDDALTINVVQNVFTIAFVILSLYPVVYIVRSMINFASKAFSQINVEKAFMKLQSISLIKGKGNE